MKIYMATEPIPQERESLDKEGNIYRLMSYFYLRDKSVKELKKWVRGKK